MGQHSPKLGQHSPKIGHRPSACHVRKFRWHPPLSFPPPIPTGIAGVRSSTIYIYMLMIEYAFLELYVYNCAIILNMLLYNIRWLHMTCIHMSYVYTCIHAYIYICVCIHVYGLKQWYPAGHTKIAGNVCSSTKKLSHSYMRKTWSIREINTSITRVIVCTSWINLIQVKQTSWKLPNNARITRQHWDMGLNGMVQD